ncbi:MAG: M13 family metallopeptidase N-terminal domain-containing protein, partial [Cyclobacteriaceae bacterium]
MISQDSIKNTLGKVLFFTICLSGITVMAQDQIKPKFIDPANMDLMVKPGDDFTNYAGGVWLQNNPVPEKETTWGSFTILRDFNMKAVHEILEEASADKASPAGSVKRRVGDFYKAAMDSVTIDKLGFSPAKVDFDRAGSVKNKNEVLDEIVYQRTHGVANPLFNFFVGQDRKHPDVMAPQLAQGGTSLPDRDYYSKD